MSAEIEAGLVLAVFGVIHLALGAWFVGMLQPVAWGTRPWWSRRFTLAVPAMMPDGTEGWWWLRKREGRGEWTARQEAAREFRWWEWPKARWMARVDFGWPTRTHWVQWELAARVIDDGRGAA